MVVKGGSVVLVVTAEQLARMFHEAYEKLAPHYGYATRKASAVPWDEVPEDNKRLMIATAGEIIKRLRMRGIAV